jgi:glycosyltransferase domain-containing protein
MLSIVVPTRGRATFMRRLLKYFADSGCPWPIVLADEGAAEDREIIASLVREHAGSLRLVHRFTIGPCDFIGKVRDALAEVATPYVVLGADDDFFSLQGLMAAVAWLEANADYSLAHGLAIGFHVAGDDAVHGGMHRLSAYRQSAVEQDSALQRVVAHLPGYATTWYSVQRTSEALENYTITGSLGLDVRFREFLPSFLAVARGKAKKLPTFYMARQMHDQQVSSVSSEGWFDWLVAPDFARQFAAFCDAVLAMVEREGPLDRQQAGRELRGAFRQFLSDRLAKEAARGARYESRLPRLVDPHVVARRLRYLAALSKPAAEEVRVARSSGDLARIEAVVRGPASSVVGAARST